MKKVTLPPMTILLVEDHDDTRHALKDWFERDDHKVLDAPDKETGLALGRKHKFDVLICDLQLTDGDGCELMQALRAEKPVVGIAMSGHCAPADFARSKAAGFLSHLVKPVPPDEMDAALAAARKELTRADSKPGRAGT
jgi:CheY-like chemotaxis protein